MILKEHFDSLPLLFAGVGTTATALLGGWDLPLKVLVISVVCDILTGLWKGFFFEEKFSSKRMREGFTTKFGYFIVIVLAVQFDALLFEHPMLRTVAVWFYIYTEGVSVLENLARIGVPIPNEIVRRLSALQGKGGDKAETDKNGNFVIDKDEDA